MLITFPKLWRVKTNLRAKIRACFPHTHPRLGGYLLQFLLGHLPQAMVIITQSSVWVAHGPGPCAEIHDLWMWQMNGIQNVTKQTVTIVRKSKLHQRSDSPGPRKVWTTNHLLHMVPCGPHRAGRMWWLYINGPTAHLQWSWDKSLCLWYVFQCYGDWRPY